MGRPKLPSGQKLTCSVMTYFNEKEHKLLITKAKEAGLSVAAFVRKAVLEKVGGCSLIG